MRLNQVVSVEKGLRQRTTGELTALHQATQKPALLTGLLKKYRPSNVEGATYPDEEQKVQFIAEEVIKRIQELEITLTDATARKDWANCSACADIKVDGQVIVPRAPVHFILYLMKQLLPNLRTMVEKMVVLDPSVDWHRDSNTGLQKTKPIESQRTRKVKKAFTAHAPTKEHPAQVVIYDEDEVVGVWETVRASGALSLQRQKAIIVRLARLEDAVKEALQEANSIDAPAQNIGAPLLQFVFGE